MSRARTVMVETEEQRRVREIAEEAADRREAEVEDLAETIFIMWNAYGDDKCSTQEAFRVAEGWLAIRDERRAARKMARDARRAVRAEMGQ